LTVVMWLASLIIREVRPGVGHLLGVPVRCWQGNQSGSARRPLEAASISQELR
jgi:hypothetical protein